MIREVVAVISSAKKLTYAALSAVVLVLAACGGAEDTSGDPEPPDAAAEADGGDSDPEAEAYFDGKTITLLVPFSAGGGTDLRARLLAEHLQQHIPGEPQVVVENVTGGGGALGMNEVALGEPDGMTLGITSPSIPLRWIRGAEGHDYDLATMNVHGAFTDTCMYYISTAYKEAAGIETLADLPDAPQAARMGYTDAAGGLPILQNILADMIGAPMQAIAGYAGSSEALLGVASGELDGSALSVSAYLDQVLPYVEEGEMEPLIQCGNAEDGDIVPAAGVEDMPTIKDLYEAVGVPMEGADWDAVYANVQIQSTLSQMVVSPAGIPDEAKRALDEGFNAAVTSDAYRQEAIDVLDTDGSPVNAETATGELQNLVETVTEEIIERWEQAVAQD
ncbi:MAG: hypothetical protein GEU28_14105 [Dehalococcoidia bacterium]|nr:hypothetical protein [Dehalococcoidia bacterium]